MMEQVIYWMPTGTLVAGVFVLWRAQKCWEEAVAEAECARQLAEQADRLLTEMLDRQNRIREAIALYNYGARDEAVEMLDPNSPNSPNSVAGRSGGADGS